MAGDIAVKFEIYCDGLRDTIVLMKRAKFGKDQIAQFKCILKEVRAQAVGVA